MNTTLAHLHRLRRPLAALLATLMLGACAATTPPGHTEAATDRDASQPSLDNQPTYLSLVRQMQGNGMWFASLAHIDALEQRWGATPQTRLLRAEALRHTDQHEASQALYEQLLGTSERAAAYRGLGLIAGARSEYARAAEMFGNARDILPADGLLLNDLGYALLMSRRFDAARLPLMQAAQLLPSHPKVRSNLALYLFTQGQAVGARQIMAEARLGDATREAVEQLARELAPDPVAQLAPTGERAFWSSLRLSHSLSNPPPAEVP